MYSNFKISKYVWDSKCLKHNFSNSSKINLALFAVKNLNGTSAFQGLEKNPIYQWIFKKRFE